MKICLLFLALLALLLSVPVVARDITEGDMETWGRHAGMGETDAIDKIDEAFSQLFQGVDYQKEPGRYVASVSLMKTAFDKIGNAVKASNDTSDPAYQALVYATGKINLAGFAALGFGIAAGAGHQPSLDFLLHYKDHGILLASVVEALGPAASKNNKDAVDFLVNVVKDDSDKPLWFMATQGLANAADSGNRDAQDAIARYAASRK